MWYDVKWRRPGDPEVLEAQGLTGDQMAFRLRGVIKMCGSVELLSVKFAKGPAARRERLEMKELEGKVQQGVEAAAARLSEFWQKENESLRSPCVHCSKGIYQHCDQCGACDHGPCGQQHHHERKFTASVE